VIFLNVYGSMEETIFFRVDACQLVNSKMEIKMILSNFDLQHFGTYHTSFCHMAKFTTSDWHRHTIFVRFYDNITSHKTIITN
jgi:hypothetical protein